MSNMLNDFHETVIRHSLMPGNIAYNGNALAGEVGEVCNNIKKILMARANPEWVTQEVNPLMCEEEFKKKLADELGDVLFYVKRVAMDFDLSITDIMKLQIIKLADQSNKYGRTFLK